MQIQGVSLRQHRPPSLSGVAVVFVWHNRDRLTPSALCKSGRGSCTSFRSSAPASGSVTAGCVE